MGAIEDICKSEQDSESRMNVALFFAKPVSLDRAEMFPHGECSSGLIPKGFSVASEEKREARDGGMKSRRGEIWRRRNLSIAPLQARY